MDFLGAPENTIQLNFRGLVDRQQATCPLRHEVVHSERPKKMSKDNKIKASQLWPLISTPFLSRFAVCVNSCETVRRWLCTGTRCDPLIRSVT